MRVYVYECVCVCIYECVCVHVCVCMCLYVHVCIELGVGQSCVTTEHSLASPQEGIIAIVTQREPKR